MQAIFTWGTSGVTGGFTHNKPDRRSNMQSMWNREFEMGKKKPLMMVYPLAVGFFVQDAYAGRWAITTTHIWVLADVAILAAIVMFDKWLHSPAASILFLSNLGPLRLQMDGATHCARQCAQKGERIVQKWRGDAPGDWQAIISYRCAVAVGFYALDGQTDPPDDNPCEGSAWSAGQLLKMREIGLRHGATIRAHADRFPSGAVHESKG
jgi:hypothetical protein